MRVLEQAAVSEPTLRPRAEGEGSPTAWRVLGFFGVITVVGHLFIAGNYGWMRDEMYYVVAGQHLSGGYVEFPAMIALLADAQRFLFGPSLIAIHVFPALTGAAIIVTTGFIAREMGGGKTAQAVAGLSVLTAPLFVGADGLFTMDAFDELWWALGFLILLRILNRSAAARADAPVANRNLWLMFGLVCGLGLMTKLTILTFGLAVVVGLLFGPARRELASPWPYLGGLIAFLFLIPYLIWNAQNGWPTLAFWHTYSHGEDASKFVVETLLLLQPLAIPLWVAGLWSLLRGRLTAYRPIAICWLFLLVFLLIGHGKSYFFAPAFVPLLAAGAVTVEALALRLQRLYPVVLTCAALILGGALLAPLVAPILPPSTLAQENSSPVQPIADKFGWPQFVRTVARVVHDLPAAQRGRAVILAGNYGEAAALILFGINLNHIPVISPHNTFWFWGRNVVPKGPVIMIDEPLGTIRHDFVSVKAEAVIPAQDGIQNEEVGRRVYVCRGLLRNWRSVWQDLQNFS